MPSEFEFALQPVLLLDCAEPGKMPTDQKMEVSKYMPVEKEVNCFSVGVLDIVNVLNKDRNDSSEETVVPNKAVFVVEMTEGEGAEDLVDIGRVRFNIK